MPHYIRYNLHLSALHLIANLLSRVDKLAANNSAKCSLFSFFYEVTYSL